MALTMQQAIANFKGPRTYNQNGATVRTTAWENYLKQNGLMGSAGGGSGGGGSSFLPPTPTTSYVGTKPATPTFTPSTHADPIATIGQPGSGIGAPQPPAAPPAPTYGGSSPLTFKDSDYWLGFDEANRGYRSQVDPLNAQVAALTDKTKYGGKTLYDFMFEQAQDKWTRDMRSARDQQAKRGLMRSGHGQQQLLDLDLGLRNQERGLSDEYGANKLTQLNTQLGQYNAQFNDPGTGTLAALAKAAQARAREKELARIQATYGMTVDPSTFTFASE